MIIIAYTTKKVFIKTAITEQKYYCQLRFTKKTITNQAMSKLSYFDVFSRCLKSVPYSRLWAYSFMRKFSFLKSISCRLNDELAVSKSRRAQKSPKGLLNCETSFFFSSQQIKLPGHQDCAEISVDILRYDSFTLKCAPRPQLWFAFILNSSVCQQHVRGTRFSKIASL